MAKIVKTVRIEESLIEKLTSIADSEFEGNQTAALEAFIKQAVALRAYSVEDRWDMFSSYRRFKADNGSHDLYDRESVERTKNLSDLLWI